jgi:hypothetical protein
MKDVQSFEDNYGASFMPSRQLNSNLPDRGMKIRKEVSSWQERRNPKQTFPQEQITKAKAISAATAGKK